jgi:vacuolar-type H+-ATPase subunit I/STV1
MNDVDVTRERLRAMRSLAIVRDRAALDQQVQKLRAAGTISLTDLDALAGAVAQEAFGTVAALVATMLDDVAQPLTRIKPGTSTGEEAPLQDEVRTLEDELAQLEGEEAELQRIVHAFSARYRDELGPLVTKLLRLRKERAEQSFYAGRSDSQRRTARNQAEAQFKRFQSVLHETAGSRPQDLSDEEQSQLKATFRQASKQCHPDVVDPSMEEEARSYFNALREAYQQNDMERVKEIAQTLDDSGFAQRTPHATPRQSQLKAKVDRLRGRIASVEASIEELRMTEAYQTVSGTDDVDAYFEALKHTLRREIRRLHRGRRVS